ncbi:MAG: hypothetical protein M1823_000981 [Watsoniomyces obsoletus]|nr:MAG: hypothetical protein M1823_000981 [Watsoniomyces obsoletus]
MTRTTPTWVNPARRDEFEDNLEADLAAGRIMDPRTPGRPVTSRWRAFILASGPPEDENPGSVATPEWWAANAANYEGPSLVDLEQQALQATGQRRRPKKKPWPKRLRRFFLRNPFLPLLLRFALWGLSWAALVLGLMLFFRSRGSAVMTTMESGIFSIVISSTAIIYLVFITYDEFSSKPLGLRPVSVKLRLVLLDQFYIVTMAANLTASAESLGALYHHQHDEHRRQQVALVVVLAVTLALWLFTFVMTTFRLVTKVARENE